MPQPFTSLALLLHHPRADVELRHHHRVEHENRRRLHLHGAGSTDVWIEKIYCGPGHGISIGSLGGTTKEEAGVQNITVRSVVFSGTQNGVRIKTWGRPTNGFVKGVNFENIVMRDVQNPVVIDQNYCPGNKNCPGQSSGINISEVKFKNIRGSSATEVAVKLDCSPSNPCMGIGLKDINLSYQNMQTLSYCMGSLM
ncbi:hypothetical protein Cni_G20015 [Canna indica]|uniref:Polygalacturonase n=1 Tax=Canna indica TaxID=4628 RepID=A0AAQ3KLR2_9LILI|nr:hypothetical protein Cni_G20015 [Canna indica]